MNVRKLLALIVLAGPGIASAAIDIVALTSLPKPQSAPYFLKATNVPRTSQYCCKVCSAGKACGDSCISRDKVCRVGAGCACDG